MILRGYAEKRRREHDEARARDHELAQLVAVAFHAPKKMPDFKPVRKRDAPKVSTEADEARVRAFFIGLATGGNK